MKAKITELLILALSIISVSDDFNGEAGNSPEVVFIAIC